MTRAMAACKRARCARDGIDGRERQTARSFVRAVLLAAAAALATPVHAAFHLFKIDQVYSNADGSVQYVVMREATGSNGENFWKDNNAFLAATSAGAAVQRFAFPSNLPSSATASKSVLIATSGFAALGLVTPDYTIPNGFVPRAGGSLNYANVDAIVLPPLPADGATAIDRNGTPVPATPKNFAGATATLMAAPPPVALDLDQHGLTGSWFKAAESGQGIEVEFYPDFGAPGTALVSGAWFTFDSATPGGADRQRWYVFSGNATRGAASIPITIGQNVGGNFAAAPVIAPTVVGNGTLAFSDCNTATLSYAFTDGSGRRGTIPITRIAPNVTCVNAGAPGTNADFAFSGNWYDPATSGQGFVFEVNPLVPGVFFAWYTYAPNGQASGVAGQRWYTGQTGQGGFAPGTRTIQLQLGETTGGVFDQPMPTGQATAPVGNATVTFTTCTSAQLQYNFTAGTNAGRAGTLNLSRVGPVPPGCVAAMADPQPPMYPPSYGYGPP